MTLLESTGIPQIDQLLRGVIGLVELSFPDRIRGYYLEGSYADGSAVSTSDVDLRVVFKSSATSEEKERFARLLDYCRLLSAYPLDIKADSEAALLRIGAIRFQAARLLYGTDIRAAVPHKPLVDYVRDNMHGQYQLFVRVRGNPGGLTFPLDYPDPAAEFYGYDCRRLRLPDGTIRAGTKDLVLNVLWPATALIGLEAAQYVTSKRDCVVQYRRWINDEWTDLIEALDALCRQQWSYLVPEAAHERQQLRALCQRGLAFENHFLARYKVYLLTELDQTDDAITLLALQRLGQILYRDAAVIAAIQAAEQRANPTLRQAATQVLARYAEITD